MVGAAEAGTVKPICRGEYMYAEVGRACIRGETPPGLYPYIG